MMSEDNRLLPLTATDRALDRHLGDIMQSKPYGVSPTDPTRLRDYLLIVLKRKWLILSLVLVVTSLVTIHMYRQPSIYAAATTIQIEPKQDSVLRSGKEIVIKTTENSSDPIYWRTQLRLLENPALARQVILTLDLQNNPQFFGSQSQTGILASLRRIFSRQRQTAATQPSTDTNEQLPFYKEDEVRSQQFTPEQLQRLEPYEDTLAANLSVDPVEGTNLVTLRYTHTDPELAQKIVNTLADIFVYNNFYRETSGSERATKTLAEKIAELQLTIKREEETRFNHARANNLPLIKSPGANLSADRLAMLSRQLLDAENERKNLQALYEAAARQTDVNAIPEVQENARIQKLREKLDTLKQERDRLLVTYTPEWHEVKKVDAQIKMLEEALSKEPRAVVTSMKSRYEAALARENSLRQAYNEQRGQFSQENQAQIQMSVLDQEIETNKQYLNTLLQRQRELENVSTDSPNNIRITNRGRVPREPIGPPRLRNVLIAFLLSLAAGIGLAFLLDFLDDTLKSVEDVDRHLHLPALALIPSTRSERLRLKGSGGGAPDATALAGSVAGATALALINDVRSPVAEAYRHLRTSLLLSSAGQPPKTILVTSSQPSEGKTTTAINTAVMLAQTGADVLIIDCDLRRPRLHSNFQVPNTRGVTNYLSGESELDDLLQPYEKLQNLKLLTSGPVPPNPAELLGSDEMRRMLNVLSERFTHIVIDSPPAISFTDASILSTMVDGVMLVVHGGKSSRAVVRRAKQQLLDVGAHIFGVVLNNVKLEQTDYYYYASYYSNYYTDDDSGSGAGEATGAPARGSS